MGLFDKIFNKNSQQVAHKLNGFFRTFTAYTPTFRSWNGGIYESELVRSAIDALARHTGKLKVEIHGNDTIRKLQHKPNEFQTWYQFLYQCRTILEIDNTLFVVPIYSRYGDIVGIYPVIPRQCEIREYQGDPWLRYHFKNGNTAALPLRECGVMLKHQYNREFFGESNHALIPTMDLIHLDNQGIKEAVKSGATFRFMARSSNFSSDEDLMAERQEFNERNLKSDTEGNGGVLLFPYTWDDIKQIDSKPYTVDPEERKLIQTNVFRYYGVNEKALQNELYGDAWSGFYEGAIETFAIQFSEVISAMLFSQREISGGSYVMLTANRLQYMSTSDKLRVSAQLADRGILNRDEVREIWNLPPLPNGEGQEYIIRGEYYNATDKINDDDINDGVEDTDEQQTKQND